MELNENEKSVFEYLFELQESGEINMFGAPGYIIRQNAFAHITLANAYALVEKWMIHYDIIKTILRPDTIIFKDE